ncbi:MAG TPA: citramalate synthase [Nitrospiria bacterium]|nr:citramalate synthase [Nitrospiria bacterium]
MSPTREAQRGASAPAIEVYDTTLRDGAQAEEVSYSAEDKLRITEKLDELGIHCIEGGWPGANPKDILYFKEVRKLRLDRSAVVAFGSTHRAGTEPDQDSTLRALLDAETEIVTIFGKSWDFHVTEALGTSLDRNLQLIEGTIAFLRRHGRRVFYDAEHFFDGCVSNPAYAMRTLKAAEAAGAERLILCDTNGGSMPWRVREMIGKVMEHVRTPLGIHAHNDGGVAVANTLTAAELGVMQVQGTVNGLGERCGNADLCAIIPNLQLKMNRRCLDDAQLARLKEVSRFVWEIANLQPPTHQPYVGESAFAHKGGVHVHAIRKSPLTYEHIRPELVGNRQRVLVSDASGRGSLLQKAADYHVVIDPSDPSLAALLDQLKTLEGQGYQFEGAEGSFELLMKKAVGGYRRFFELIGFRVIVEKRREGEEAISEATIQLKVDGVIEHTAAEGRGPVGALDNALRKALETFYPELQEVRLIDYKVRVLAAGAGTSSRVRVLIESGDAERKWGTVGVSENIIEASWQALADSIEYKLLRSRAGGKSEPQTAPHAGGKTRRNGRRPSKRSRRGHES